MLTLTPQFLVSTVTALATWGRQRNASDAGDRHARANTKRADASLRFVHFAGFWSHYTPGRHCSSWPLPFSGGIEDLAEFAQQQHGLAPSPRAGDVFLLASVGGAGQHSLAGIVVAVETVSTMLNGRPAFVCVTAEGELHGTVRAPGVAKVRLVRRKLSSVFGDCFIRWYDLPAGLSPAGADERTLVRYEIPDTLLTLKRTQRRRAA